MYWKYSKVVMQHLHTVPIVSSNLTTSTNRIFCGVLSVVVCTPCCELGSMGSFPIEHPKIFYAPLVKKYNTVLITRSRRSVTSRGYQFLFRRIRAWRTDLTVNQ